MGSSGKSGGTASPLTTKGDVWGFDTANNRIPVGSNTQVLTADSAQALGLKWAAAAGGVTWPLTNTGDEAFQPNSVVNSVLTLHNNASAANIVTLTGTATGSDPTLVVSGDANRGLILNPAGTGTITVQGKGDAGIPLTVQGNSSTQTGDLLDIYQNSGGNALFKFATASSGANGLTFTASAGSGAVTMAVAGTGANVGLTIQTKGSGTLILNGLSGNILATGAGGVAQFYDNSAGGTGSAQLGGNASIGTLGRAALTATGTGSGVNGVTITQAAATAAPTIAATGSDTNIDLIVNSKGSGVVNIGPASAAAAISGSVGPATLATTTGGATGPATAGQNQWLKIKINGTINYLPAWQ